METTIMMFAFIILLSFQATCLHRPVSKVQYKHVKRFVITAEGSDDLEMMSPAPEHAEIGQKLRAFHKHVLDHTLVEERPRFWHVVKKRKFKKEDYPDMVSYHRFQRQGDITEEHVDANRTKPSMSYEELLVEYNDETKNDTGDGNLNETTPKTMSVNCSSVSGIGLSALTCAVSSISKQPNTLSSYVILGGILGTYMVLCLAVAAVLWCWKGWCCCCIYHEICNPRKTARDVQRYLAYNAPGMYTDEETGLEVNYEPSEIETRKYEKLQNMILNF